MYRYSDKSGNVFELLEEGPSLVFEANGAVVGLPRVAAHDGRACASGRVEKTLDQLAYMHLVSAFSAAIDNTVFHRELCNKCSSIITTLENGQQRRYILSDQGAEKVALEDALLRCVAG